MNGAYQSLACVKHTSMTTIIQRVTKIFARKSLKWLFCRSLKLYTGLLIWIWPIFRFLPWCNETHCAVLWRTLQLNSQHGLKAIWSDKFIWKRGNHITQGDKIGGVHFPFLYFDWNDANMCTYKCQIKFSY